MYRKVWRGLFMDYEQAKEFLYNGDGAVDKSRGVLLSNLYYAITDDKTLEGIQMIKELTACDDSTAKLIWVDLKMDFGSKENNPILQAREDYQNEQLQQDLQYQNNAECPYCHSKNTKKISGLSKAGSVALWGVFAVGKVSKQWHCNNCKSDF